MSASEHMRALIDGVLILVIIARLLDSKPSVCKLEYPPYH